MAVDPFTFAAISALLSGGVGSILSGKQSKNQERLMREQMAANERLANMRLEQEKEQALKQRQFQSELAAKDLLQQQELANQQLRQSEAMESRRLQAQAEQQRSANIARQADLEAKRAGAVTAASQAKEGRRALAARALQRKNIKARPSKGFSGVSGAVLDEGIS